MSQALEPREGLYLEDGRNLWRVVQVNERRATVLLENARWPTLPLVERPVGVLAADGYRVVPRNP